MYSENGAIRPFNAVVQTPGTTGSAFSVRNRGPLEYPMQAGVGAVQPRNYNNNNQYGMVQQQQPMSPAFGGGGAQSSKRIQGGSLRTFTFDASVSCVQVQLVTDGMPLYALVEILQGPGCVRQVAEINNQDGLNNPFMANIDLPGNSNTIVVHNKGPMEFPIKAQLTPVQSTNVYNNMNDNMYRPAIQLDGGGSSDNRWRSSYQYY